jgi:plastocyanin
LLQPPCKYVEEETLRRTAVGTCLVFVLGGLAILAPAATAKEKTLTLYSPKINSLPYVHDTHDVTLRADGVEAPAEPGYITSWKEMALVDSKNPKAKPLPIGKMMVHHFLYYAAGRVDQLPGTCWPGVGFIGGRGEEHPFGRNLKGSSKAFRDRYGINNRTAAGKAPTWHLTAMVMNHYKRPKSFYVRTKITYTNEPRQSISPVIIGKCSQIINGMAYDVPGGGKRGSNFVDQSDWVAPFSGRLLMASNHQHGGGKYHTLSSLTCGRRLFKSPVYHGTRKHIYNTIRPILHEPGPIATGAYGTAKGIPIVKGEVLRRVAVHDNRNLHVAAMGFWATYFVKDDNVKKCGKLPKDITELNRPKKFDRTPNHMLVVPQLTKPQGVFTAWDGNPITVGDDFFRPGKLVTNAGQPVTWRFSGRKGHTVTVANGPRGFSSIYWGRRYGRYTVTPKVRGTYKLTCLVHPTSMSQTLEVK